MITFSEYIDVTKKLIKSLIYKSTDIAMQINRELMKTYGSDISIDWYDQASWKYYINASGNYHTYINSVGTTVYTNEVMTITSLDDNLEYTLTKELLADHPLTKAELLKYDIFYTTLLKQYPNEETLINGMLNPIKDMDHDTILRLKEGLILSYNPLFIEENETSVISELSTYSIGYFRRWIIREMSIIDNYYIGTAINTLVSKMFLKLLAIRLSNIFSYKTHSFHIENFLASKFSIINELDSLDHKEKLWLYMNVRYFTKNGGRNDVLNMLLSKLLNDKNIPVSNIRLINNIPNDVNLDSSDPTSLTYTNKDIYFLEEPIFTKTDTFSNTVYTPLELLNLETSEANISSNAEVDETPYINDYESSIRSNAYISQSVKDILIQVHNFNAKSTFLTFYNVFNYLAYSIDKGIYNTTIIYSDASTGKTYSLTPKAAFLFIVKILSDIYGLENYTFTDYKYDGILDTTKTTADTCQNLLGYTTVFDIFTAIEGNRPSEEGMNTVEAFNTYITSAIDFFNLLWTIGTNSHDMVLSSDMKIISNRLTQTATVDFRVDGVAKTIDELLVIEDIDFTIPSEYKHVESIKDIILLITGIELNKNDLSTYINNRVKIINKLSSYSIQFLIDSDNFDMKVPYHGIMGSMHGGIIDIESANLYVLEEFIGEHISNGDDEGDDTKVSNSGNLLEGTVYDTTPTIVAKDLTRLYENDYFDLTTFHDNDEIVHIPFHIDKYLAYHHYYDNTNYIIDMTFYDTLTFYQSQYVLFNGTTNYGILPTTIEYNLREQSQATMMVTMLRTSFVNVPNTHEEHAFMMGGGNNLGDCREKIFIELNYNNEDKARIRLGMMHADYDYGDIIVDIPHVLGEYKFAITIVAAPSSITANVYINHALVGTMSATNVNFTTVFDNINYIGRLYAHEGRPKYFYGSVFRDFRLFNRALSLSDIIDRDNEYTLTVNNINNIMNDGTIVVEPFEPQLFLERQ